MMTLQEQHPDTAIQFSQGGFVVQKTKPPFSSIAIDQAHEQNNKVVKGDGGAVGLLQNPKALLRWMVGGGGNRNLRGLLESLRTIAWMEVQEKLPGPISSTMSILRLHKSNLPLRLVLSFKYLKIIMRNSFMEESEGLPVLDSRDVADPAIVQTVREIEKTGQDQYKYKTE